MKNQALFALLVSFAVMTAGCDVTSWWSDGCCGKEKCASKKEHNHAAPQAEEAKPEAEKADAAQ